MDGLLVTGSVSMCSCGRADAERGGEGVEWGGEFDVSPGGEADGGASVEEECGDGGGEEDILKIGKLHQRLLPATAVSQDSFISVLGITVFGNVLCYNCGCGCFHYTKNNSIQNKC